MTHIPSAPLAFSSTQSLEGGSGDPGKTTIYGGQFAIISHVEGGEVEQSEAVTDLMIRRFQKTHGLFAQVPADDDLRSRHCDRGCESSRIG